MIGGGKLYSKHEFSNHFAIHGTIDDLRIYSRALTVSEIQADMATPVGP